MARDDKTPTGRDLDKAIELEEARLSERVRMRLDSYEDEDSTVIEQRAVQQVKTSSTPAPAKSLIAVLNTLPANHRLLGLFVIGFFVLGIVALGGTKALGLW